MLTKILICLKSHVVIVIYKLVALERALKSIIQGNTMKSGMADHI